MTHESSGSERIEVSKSYGNEAKLLSIERLRVCHLLA